MLVYQFRILSNVACVEISHADIKQNIEDIGDIEKGVVQSILLHSHRFLHTYLYAKNPEGLDRKVEY